MPHPILSSRATRAHRKQSLARVRRALSMDIAARADFVARTLALAACDPSHVEARAYARECAQDARRWRDDCHEDLRDALFDWLS